MLYPVAEMFHSIQGEGAQSGMPMTFVRLAGCNVGKPYTREERASKGLHIFQNECTIYDGRKFACDTNYKASMQSSPEYILACIQEMNHGCTWVSITGGEPLIHDLVPLIECLNSAGLRIHMETSGTIPIEPRSLNFVDYLAVSPKYPYLDVYSGFADEIRILIDEDFDWAKLPQSVQGNPEKIWISPVNYAGSLNPDNGKQCILLANEHPGVRLSLQIHKVLGIR